VSTRTATDITRVTVIAQTRWAEVGVPADLPLADLLPALVVHVGDDELADRRVVLQRLGTPPLNEDLSPLALGIRDGETLYLRPQEDELPAVRFDDLVDGVATGVRARPTWSVPRLRRLFFGLATLSMVIGLGLLLLVGQAGPLWLRPAVAASTALGGLVAAAVLAHQEWGGVFARMLISAVLMPGTAAAALLLAGRAAAADSPMGQASLAGEAIWVGTAWLFAIVASGLTVPGCGPLHAGWVLVSVALAGGGLATQTFSLTASDTGVLVLVVGTFVGQLLATNAYRLAGIQIPILPTRASELDQDVDPLPGGELLARARSAEAFFAALSLAIGVILSVAGVLAARGGDRWTTALVLTAAVLHLVRSRSFIGVVQRLSVITIGCSLLVAEVVQHTKDDSTLMLVVAAVGFGVLTAGLVVAARFLPGKPLVPHLGRAAEIVETIAALALVPLALAAMSIYARVRGIPG
jgi:type VII secretion integral membrane protein EccD